MIGGLNDNIQSHFRYISQMRDNFESGMLNFFSRTSHKSHSAHSAKTRTPQNRKVTLQLAFAFTTFVSLCEKRQRNNNNQTSESTSELVFFKQITTDNQIMPQTCNTDDNNQCKLINEQHESDIPEVWDDKY